MADKNVTVTLMNNSDLKMVSIVLTSDEPISINDLKDILTQYARLIPDAAQNESVEAVTESVEAADSRSDQERIDASDAISDRMD